MSSTENKMIKAATYIIQNPECNLGTVSKNTGIGNALIRGVIRVMELSNNTRISFGGKKIKTIQVQA